MDALRFFVFGRGTGATDNAAALRQPKNQSFPFVTILVIVVNIALFVAWQPRIGSRADFFL